MRRYMIWVPLSIASVFLFILLSPWQDVYAQTKSTGYACVARLTVSADPVLLGQSFSISFSLKETKGFPKTFESVVIAIHAPNGAYLFDFASYDNVSIDANGTWSQTATKTIYPTNPTGTYKAVVRGKVGGQWFDFETTASGVNPTPFVVVFRPAGI